MRRNCVIFSLLLGTASAGFTFPFTLPFVTRGPRSVSSSPAVPQDHPYDASKTVAIIGAGAGGSSAAFFISKAKERYGLDIDVHVYEKNGYVGGRSTTVHPYDDPDIQPVELGASIFININKNLMRASEEFNLSLVSFTEAASTTGIWDGEKFVLTMGSGGFWDQVKMVYRYGYFSLKNMDMTAAQLRDALVSQYNNNTDAWTTMESLVDRLNYTEALSEPASSFFKSHGVSERLYSELIDSATRVNYGQNVDEIHGLGGAVCLLTSGASSVLGGNWQIFENFLNASGATVFLNSTVKSIKWNDSLETWTIRGPDGPVEYKAIIFAAPYHFSGVSIPDSVSSQIPVQPYIHLHVTLLATTAVQANPLYFGLKPTDNVPNVILTTSELSRDGGLEPEFNSVSQLRTFQRGNQTEYIVKIFSKQRISDAWIANIFNDTVGWVVRKEWDAYPQLHPNATFAPIKLDKGFFYVNSFEPLISTMETETLAARNVVDLLLKEEFGSGLCMSKTDVPEFKTGDQEVLEAPPTPDSQEPSKEFVLGWDC